MTQTLTIQSEAVEHRAPAPSGARPVTFVRPLLGFPRSRSFELRSLGERYAPFMALGSVEEPGLAFIVVAPGLLFSDYVVEIGEADVELLDLHGAQDVEVLALVSRHAGAAPTVNLMGPLVVNRRLDIASQVVLQDGIYGAAVPVDATTARFGAPSQGPLGSV